MWQSICLLIHLPWSLVFISTLRSLKRPKSRDQFVWHSFQLFVFHNIKMILITMSSSAPCSAAYLFPPFLSSLHRDSKKQFRPRELQQLCVFSIPVPQDGRIGWCRTD